MQQFKYNIRVSFASTIDNIVIFMNITYDSAIPISCEFVFSRREITDNMLFSKLVLQKKCCKNNNELSISTSLLQLNDMRRRYRNVSLFCLRTRVQVLSAILNHVICLFLFILKKNLLSI